MLAKYIQCGSCPFMHKTGPSDKCIRDRAGKPAEISDGLCKRVWTVIGYITGDSTVKCCAEINRNAGIAKIHRCPLRPLFDSCHCELSFHFISDHFHPGGSNGRNYPGNCTDKHNLVGKAERLKFLRLVLL